ncbi:MAG: hypothetical protein ACTSV5_05385 [Promethearchaeota archaeon]
MSDNELKRLWSEFGRSMNMVAIMMVLSFIGGITGIIAFIFLLISLGNLKNINFYLKEPKLEEFRGKYIQAFILRFIGTLVMVGGLIGMIFSGFGGDDWTILFIPIVLGLVLIIGGAVIEMKAWEILGSVFMERVDQFPPILHRDLVEGCNNLKTAALMYAIGFLFITMLVGIIFQIIGYFKLAKLKDLLNPYYYGNGTPTPTPVSATSMQDQPSSTKGNKFCSSCGAQVKGEGKFCSECGAPIN